MTITAWIEGENATLVDTQYITLGGNAHTSFAFPDRLAATAGKRGIVIFQSTTDGLTGLELRFSPFGTFTSVPTILQ
ncbi:hypothetical protein SBA4_2940012 [Candidatus Sulfopaludibacter sp. SbA4]|nr:hypothetical protein SBA4_2940012 [Candidatus Sulfopaludibacter sp. SbA4]